MSEVKVYAEFVTEASAAAMPEPVIYDWGAHPPPRGFTRLPDEWLALAKFPEKARSEAHDLLANNPDLTRFRFYRPGTGYMETPVPPHNWWRVKPGTLEATPGLVRILTAGEAALQIIRGEPPYPGVFFIKKGAFFDVKNRHRDQGGRPAPWADAFERFLRELWDDGEDGEGDVRFGVADDLLRHFLSSPHGIDPKTGQPFVLPKTAWHRKRQVEATQRKVIDSLSRKETPTVASSFAEASAAK